jgi:aspartyl-tRNA(Asn)/glutamyl-tRNA(Gln) amidotransferase subunit A
MAEEDLLYMSAQQAAAMIRRRKLSPVELTEAVLAQTERIAPLNAFVTVLWDEARAAARAAEQALMRGTALAPLHGVPVHVKDQVDTAGIPTTFGSAIFADHVPSRDDVLITQLRAAGAILVGKTRLPEFGNKGLTDGPSFGTTRNPWDPSRTCGGSSGGAAAAIAAGAGPLALGTDGAGSIRIPAACCGVVGLKPTLGIVPWEAATDAFGNYTYAGPITRSASDAAVMLRVLAGASPRDPWSLGAGKDLPLSPGLIGRDLSAIRIGWIRKTANPQLDPDMEANARAALAVLSQLGAQVEDVTEPIDWIEFPGRILYQGNFHVAMQKHLPQWRDKMDPTLLAFVERGGTFSMADFRRAQYARTELFRTLQGLLSRYDALIMPTLTRTALAAEFDAANDEVVVNGVKCGITRLGWTAYVYPFNLTGHPALTVPSGFAADGLPTSVQIVGRWGADMDVLRLGALLEEARLWSGKRPPLPR